MLRLMLCGASDMDKVERQFSEVAADFGAEAMCYLDGRVRYRNSATASWVENSRMSVSSADLCVFVILEKYGEITWTTELSEALALGVPKGRWSDAPPLSHPILRRAALVAVN